MRRKSMILIGNYLWNERYWSPPVGCRGAVDLASHAQLVAATPGQARPCGLFLCGSVPAGFDGAMLSSDDPQDARVDATIIDAWQTLTGYRPNGDTIAGLLWDHLTNGADPANEAGPGVLEPKRSGVIELVFGRTVRREQFSFGEHANTGKIRDALKYRLLATRSLARDGKIINPTTKQVDFEYHRRVADSICEKYAGRDPKRKAELLSELRPVGWSISETLLTHNTTLTESFDTSDGDALGPNLAWTEVTGDIDIVSNRAQRAGATTDACARTDSSLSGADHYAQIDRTFTSTGTRNASPAARFASGATTYYLTAIMAASSAIYKRVAGTFTSLAGLSNDANTCTIKIECNGSSLVAYKNGSSVGSVTDTAISGNLQVGFQIQSSGDHCDNFDGADLATGHPAIRRLGTSRSFRPVEIGRQNVSVF